MRFGAIRLVVVLAVLGLLGTACAKATNAGSTGGTTTPTPSATGAPVTLAGVVTNKGTVDVTSQGSVISITIKADNDGTTAYYFEPTFLKANPGAKVTVHLENEGTFPHNFSIEALHINEDLAKGEKKEITFTLPAVGVVNFFCEYHHSKGMQGAFFFTAGQSVAPTTGTSSPSSGYGY